MKQILAFTITTFTLNVFAQTPPPYIPTNGLVAWYPFNGNANDESGNGNNGVVNGATLNTDRDGHANRAYSFAGSLENIRVDSVHQTNVLQYSVTAWFKKNSSSIGQEGTIFCGNNPCYAPGGLRLHVGSTNQVYWGAEFDSCSGVGLITTNQNYADDTWHFVAAVFNSSPGLIDSSQLKIYVDDSVVSQIQYSGGNLSTVIAPINNQNLPTTIGNVTALNDYFQGTLDDIGIWSRPLTPTEVTQIYLADTTTQPCPPISLTYSITDATPGLNDGAVKINVLGGDTPYLYSLDSITFQSNSTFNSLDTGTYQVYVTDSNGCSAQGTFTIPPTTVGFGMINNHNGIEVFPNPFSDKVIVQLNATKDVSIKLRDITGREIFSQRYYELETANQVTINTDALNGGIYLLELTNHNETYIYKLVGVKPD